jgi:hypothetical protein
MAANPTECRQRAEFCIELAKRMEREDRKRSLICIANNWVKLADELEKADASRKRAAAQPRSDAPLFR